jgi:hypothetical protein
MVTKMREVDAEQPGGLDHVRAGGHGDFPTVDVDGDEVGWSGLGHRESFLQKGTKGVLIDDHWESSVRIGNRVVSGWQTLCSLGYLLFKSDK